MSRPPNPNPPNPFGSPGQWVPGQPSPPFGTPAEALPATAALTPAFGGDASQPGAGTGPTGPGTRSSFGLQSLLLGAGRGTQPFLARPEAEGAASAASPSQRMSADTPVPTPGESTEPDAVTTEPEGREGGPRAMVRRLGRSPSASQRLPARAAGSAEKRSSGGTKVMATPEEIGQLTTVLCNGLPAELNDREALLEHFGQFGRVARITCNPRKGCATVRFEDHQSAELAKKRGARISDRCAPLQIFWCSKRRPSSDAGTGPARTGVRNEGGAPPPTRPQTRDLTPDDFVELRTSEEQAAESQTPAPSAPAPAAAPAATLASTLARRAASRLTKVAPRKARAALGRESDGGTTALGEESLAGLLTQAAHSVGERYRVLDARDKIIRLRSQRQSDLATARATRGSCPDMCPEKERYSRTHRKLLSSFEVLPGSDGVMDPSRMVKEYSRSSADQEEPLPHELRPPHVLRLTMDYLLVHVMDPPHPPPVGEWYDFIWNRTRSIRKDLTQQHLCEPSCVSLVEQCARFHIHCASALCEEDVSVFDPRINGENLAKCLQTLKHLYYDLGLRGLRCPNEPEFRAYDVLLHLDQADTVRQVQALDAWVRRSAPVCLAVSALGALSSGNWVRFFRLVGVAPYLSACLLHRYFGRVRLQAFHTLLRAFCQTSHREEFSLESLGRQLGFDSPSEVRAYARALGLGCSEDALLLDRSSQIQTESGGPPAGRSRRLVDAKRTCSVGEVVNGGPLPLDPTADYRPHDSFSLDGVLRGMAYDARDQAAKCWPSEEAEPGEEPVLIKGPQEPEPPPQQPPPPEVPIEVVRDVARDLLDEAVQEHVEGLGRDFLLGQVAHATVASLVAEETCKMAKECCQEAFLGAEEQRLQELLLAKQRDRERRLGAQEAIAGELIEEVLMDAARQACRSCHREAQERLWEEQGTALLGQLVREVAEEEAALAAAQVLAREQALHEAATRLADTCRRRHLLGTCFARWVEHCEAERWRRLARETFPACPSLGLDPRNPAFGPSRKRARLSDDVFRGLEASLALRLLSEELDWAPLDLSREWGHPSKLVVYLPERDPGNAREALARVQARLGCRPSPDAQVETLGGSRWSVSVVRGPLSAGGLDHVGRPRLLRGASAVLFVATGKSAGPRLRELLCWASVLRPVPCVCVLDLCGSQEERSALGETLALCSAERLLPEACRVLSTDDRPCRTLGRTVQEAVRWCSESRVALPQLQTSRLGDFVEQGVSRMVFDVAYAALPDFQGDWQLPTRLVDLYNAVLRHLAAVAASSSLSDMSVEFQDGCDWSAPDRLEALQEAVLGLLLPAPGADLWKTSAVWDYLELLCGSNGPRGTAALLFASAEETLRRQAEGGLSSPAVWVDILHDCFCHLLRNFDHKELLVHYLPEELSRFSLPTSWQDVTGPMPSPANTEEEADSEASEPSSSDEESVGSGEAVGGAEPEVPWDLERLVARQRALSRSLTSRLEALLAPPLSTAPKGGEVCVRPEGHQDVEALVAAAEEELQARRRSSALLQALLVTALDS
ncbi:germinal-center associated nuclear protein [Ixodes scapularis]|uniref:germinal-center associated nuclear protein n=1 Tax=Ixodes scapularis TaxID=6945 RepID=UPI001A9DD7C1|nr:germinal-center associated nuclear protein [Ixodes scapularis]XP_040078397.1 germinal-center associated nuclear protein [Ixodes scapularis]